MNESMTNNKPEKPIDEQKLRRMVYKIYGYERQNSKTGKYGDKDMKGIIESIIEEEAKKCY